MIIVITITFEWRRWWNTQIRIKAEGWGGGAEGGGRFFPGSDFDVAGKGGRRRRWASRCCVAVVEGVQKWRRWFSESLPSPLPLHFPSPIWNEKNGRPAQAIPWNPPVPPFPTMDPWCKNKNYRVRTARLCGEKPACTTTTASSTTTTTATLGNWLTDWLTRVHWKANGSVATDAAQISGKRPCRVGLRCGPTRVSGFVRR